jgi:hypothetical protein
VAEDVEAINPDLVVRDKDGKANTVRYEAVNVMLLNEFLKEHKEVEELRNEFQSTVALQKEQIQALTAQLKQQAEQIQRVHAQMETNRPATEVTLSNPVEHEWMQVVAGIDDPGYSCSRDKTDLQN